MAQFTKTIRVKNLADVPIGTQPGQWLKIGNEKKSRQLVSSTNFGVIAVKAPKGGTVSRAALRLARDRGKVAVLGVATRD